MRKLAKSGRKKECQTGQKHQGSFLSSLFLILPRWVCQALKMRPTTPMPPAANAGVATAAPEATAIAVAAQAGALDHPGRKHLTRGFSAIFATGSADPKMIGRYKPVVPPPCRPLLRAEVVGRVEVRGQISGSLFCHVRTHRVKYHAEPPLPPSYRCGCGHRGARNRSGRRCGAGRGARPSRAQAPDARLLCYFCDHKRRPEAHGALQACGAHLPPPSLLPCPPWLRRFVPVGGSTRLDPVQDSTRPVLSTDPP